MPGKKQRSPEGPLRKPAVQGFFHRANLTLLKACSLRGPQSSVRKLGLVQGKGAMGTLMLSAKSSSALAPMVSMEVMRPGSLFLVLAAVP